VRRHDVNIDEVRLQASDLVSELRATLCAGAGPAADGSVTFTVSPAGVHPEVVEAVQGLSAAVADCVLGLSCRKGGTDPALSALSDLHGALVAGGVSLSDAVDVRDVALQLAKIGAHTAPVVEALVRPPRHGPPPPGSRPPCGGHPRPRPRGLREPPGGRRARPSPSPSTRPQCARVPVEERARLYSTAAVEYARRGRVRAVERMFGALGEEFGAGGAPGAGAAPLVPDAHMMTAAVHMYGQRGFLAAATELVDDYLSRCALAAQAPAIGPVNALVNATLGAEGPHEAAALYCRYLGCPSPPPEGPGGECVRCASPPPGLPRGPGGPAALAADAVTMGTLAKAAMRAGSGELARWVEGELERWGVTGTEGTYVCLIKAFERAGEYDVALRVKDAAGAAGGAVTRGLWGATIMCAGRAGRIEEARALWREMREGGPPPRQPQFHALLTACAACHRSDVAAEALAEMRREGVPRSDQTYLLALSACHPGPGGRPRDEHVSAAEAFLADMARDLPGQPPTLRIMTLLVSLYGDAGLPHSALACFGELRARAAARGGGAALLDARAYSRAIRACRGSPGLAGRALELYRESQRHGMSDCRELYGSALTALREAGDLDGAFQVYRDLRRAGFAPDNQEFRKLLALCAERAMDPAAAPPAGAGAGEPGAPPEPGPAGPAGGGPAPAPAGDGFLGSNLDLSLETIDLHGLSVPEARAAVLLVLKATLGRHQAGLAVEGDLLVVTGAGLHSSVEGPKLQGAVVEMLEGLGLPVQTDGAAGGDFSMLLTPRTVLERRERRMNAGRVKVTNADLCWWLGRRRSL